MNTETNQRDTAYRIGQWRVDPAAREATDGTQIRRFSPKSMAVLQEIVAARGDVVRRTDLLDRVWPDVYVGEESLTHAISELRRAFGDSRRQPNVIETVQKTGYRLRAPLTFDEPTTLVPTGPGAEEFNLDAYLLCLEARRQNERGGCNGVKRAEELSREAVGRAPRFALAHAEYAISATMRRLYRGGERAGLAEALRMSETAIGLRPDLAYGHAARGYTLAALGLFSAARDAFDVALSCDLGDFDVHYLYARALFAAGEAATAGLVAERAAALQPEDYRALYLASRSALALGDKERSLVLARACLARVQRRFEIDPYEPRSRNIFGPLLALLDRPDEAVAAVMEDEMSGANLEFYNVVAMAKAGETRAAIDRFEAVVDAGWRHSGWLKAEPAIAKLQREPRFRRIASVLEAA